MKKKFLAFTLAETLIVMAVIGVVASLTIPNLNTNTHSKKEITKLQKFYSELTDAWSRTESIYGKYSDWDIELQELKNVKEHQPVIMDRMLDFLRTTDMKFENGRIKNVVSLRWVYYLPSGYVMYIEPNNEDEEDLDATTSICSVKNPKNYGKLKVWELNGFRKMQNNKSTLNYLKSYWFYLTEEGFIPVGSQRCGSVVDEEKWKSCTKLNYAAVRCTGTLIEYSR